MGGSKDPKVKETPEQRELAKIAMERYQHGQKFKPYQQMYMDRVDNLNKQSSYDEAKGQLQNVREAMRRTILARHYEVHDITHSELSLMEKREKLQGLVEQYNRG